jgi:uncharacterized protein YkwD
MDAALQHIADTYATELAQRRDLSHVSTTPGWRTLDERVHTAGLHPRDYAENLALLSGPPGMVPKTVVQMWLNSPGHRRNMLDPIFTRTGLGVALGSDNVWYLTQEFATP